MNKRILFAAFCFATTLGVGLPAFGQVMPERENTGIRTEGGKSAKIDQYKNLGLTREQQKKMGELNKDIRMKTKLINEDSSLSRQERRQKLQAVKNDMAEKRKSILTPSQYAQFEKNQASARQGKKEGEKDAKIVTNTPASEKKGTDENGLSRKNEKKASKQWNDLDLTADQKRKLQELNRDKEDKLRNIRENMALSREEKRRQMEQIQYEQNRALDDILTPQQKTAYLQKQRDQRMMRTGRLNENDNFPKKR